jgi:hypothetical protein
MRRRDGITRAVAAWRYGVSETTIYKWEHDDVDNDTNPYRDTAWVDGTLIAGEREALRRRRSGLSLRSYAALRGHSHTHQLRLERAGV